MLEIQTETREGAGKGVARKLRRQAKLPGIIYGKSLEETIRVSVPEKAIEDLLRTKLGKNTFLTLKLDSGKDYNCLIREYQGDVISRKILHLDFWNVDPNQEIEVTVPVVLVGRPVGVKSGGIQEVPHRKVSLICQASKIPADIQVDVSELNIGQNIHLGDVKLPEGTSIKSGYNPTLCSVIVNKRAVAAGEVAAPAAGAAPAADAPKA